MSQQAVKEYLLSIILIYQVSSKAEKSVLLDHAELVTKGAQIPYPQAQRGI